VVMTFQPTLSAELPGWRRVDVLPLHRLVFSVWIPVVNPRFITSYYTGQHVVRGCTIDSQQHKFLTLEKQPANNIYDRLTDVYGGGARLIQLSPGGLLNLNVAEHRLKRTPELDGQSKRPLMIVAMLLKNW